MKRAAFLLAFMTTVCAVAEAQTTLYLKKDHIYAGVGGGEIAVVVPAPSDSTAPTAPSGLGVTATTATTVALSWTGSTDSGGSGLLAYKVYRAKGSGVALPVGTVNSSTTSFTDSGPLEPSTAYSFFIVAVDAAQNHSSASNTVNPTTSSASGDTTAPSAPANLRGIPTTRQSTYKVRLDFDPATDVGGSGVAGYKVYRDNSLISGGTPITNLYYEDSTNTANTSFSYKVKTVDGMGNVSGDSNVVTITTLREGTVFNFNQPDDSGIKGMKVRSNTLQRIGYQNCPWDVVAMANICLWDDYALSSESSFKASVNVLARVDSYTGVGVWMSGDAAYRVYATSLGYLVLDYWDTLNDSSVTNLDSWTTLPAGPGVLTVDADSANRRIKVYWNGTLRIDYTDPNTSRANSGAFTLASYLGGFSGLPASIFDDVLVER